MRHFSLFIFLAACGGTVDPTDAAPPQPDASPDACIPAMQDCTAHDAAVTLDGPPTTNVCVTTYGTDPLGEHIPCQDPAAPPDSGAPMLWSWDGNDGKDCQHCTVGATCFSNETDDAGFPLFKGVCQ